MIVPMEILEAYQKDLLIVISNSGNTQELIPVIKFANRYKIILIGIVSKNSLLHKASDIKLLYQGIKEAGLGIVPTSSTSEQLAIGDCLAVVALNKKRLANKILKNFIQVVVLAQKLKL